jgi:GNAT superfamily N-acetyltransferase
MAKDQSNDVLSDAERAIAQRLIDEINEFNLDATGIAEVHELLTVETGGDGELIAGVYGWSWGGTCWIEALWVREDMRRRGVGSRLLAAVEKDHDAMVVRSLLWTPTRSKLRRSTSDTVSRSSASSRTIQKDTRSCSCASSFQVDRHRGGGSAVCGRPHRRNGRSTVIHCSWRRPACAALHPRLPPQGRGAPRRPGLHHAPVQIQRGRSCPTTREAPVRPDYGP